MAHEKHFPRPGPLAGRLARITRLMLGGVIVGSFVGVYLGALLGLGYAAWAGDLSPTLDGALLGGAALALIGGCYGAILGVTERNNSADFPVHGGPAAGSPTPSGPSGRAPGNYHDAGHGARVWPTGS
jgi:hypothetical protein